jgi:NitT/TauT family transport system substrate-binding protein
VLACASPALAQEKATLRLNWLIYGFHTPFHLGVEKGYYKAEGIDLEIGEGQGSGRAVQIIAAKGDTFGLSDGASIINGIDQGRADQGGDGHHEHDALRHHRAGRFGHQDDQGF